VAARGAQLTHRLLAFSRRQPLRPSPININNMVTSMMPLLRRTLNEAITIDEALDADTGTTLADGSNLENALLNLVVNARDAMPAGGRLVIRTCNAVIPAGRDDVMEGEYVLLIVSDTGTGMSDEVRARAFEPFFTTKEAGKGSGLGLATIYGFVRQSGGFIDIDSTSGRGTTITLGLPRVYVSGAESTPVAPVPHKGNGQVILVVEDDEFVRGTVVRVVGDLGYRAIAAPNAESCLEIIALDPSVDLMMTDVVMPGMNGWDLAKAVEGIRPGLPVLFTTGYTENVLLQRASLDGRIRVLSKPFNAGDLAQALEELLSSQLPVPPGDKDLDVNSEPKAYP
jgi:CheY-like chemotaxis protein